MIVKKYIPLLILSPLVVLLDQLTKWWVVQNLRVGQNWVILENFFYIGHIKNRGAAFGMLANWDHQARPWVFYLITLVALLALFAIYAQTRPQQRRVQIPLALILGGAVGNMIDRVRHGEVVDFLVFHWQDKIADFSLFGKHYRFALSWPAFNVADMAITCGALFLVITMLFSKEGTRT